MKKLFSFTAAAALVVMAVGSQTLRAADMSKTATSTSASAMKADDPLKVAPTMYKLDFENDQVRVMEVTFKPGEKIPKHSHPDHYVYVLEPGQLTITKADGTSNVADLQKGQVLFIPAESHSAQNTGKSSVKLLVNELKAGAAHTH